MFPGLSRLLSGASYRVGVEVSSPGDAKALRSDSDGSRTAM